VVELERVQRVVDLERMQRVVDLERVQRVQRTYESNEVVVGVDHDVLPSSEHPRALLVWAYIA